MMTSADDHVIGNAPPGTILRGVSDDPEEGTAMEDTPQAERPDARPYVRDWHDPVAGRVRRVGNAEAAGRLCVTEESPQGVSGHQYRRMVSKPPVTFEPPPGPIEVAGAVLTELVPRWREEYTDRNGVFHPGREVPRRETLYDLDEVREWNERRPGRGKRGRWKSRQGRERAEAEVETEAAGEPVLTGARA